MTCNPEPHGYWRRAATGIAGLAIVGASLALVAGTPAARADAGAARASLRLSQSLLMRGNATGARTHAMRAVAEDPEWGAAHVAVARAQLALGDGLAAEAELDRAVKVGFDPRETHHLRADARLLQGDAQGALAEAAKATAPNAAHAARVRGQALAASDPAAAIAVLEAAARRSPADAPTWVALGRLRYRAGDIVGAINASERAVATGPNLVDALQLRGEMLRQQYGLLAALPWFEAALARDPYDHDALIEYAATLGDAGRTRDMLSAVRRAAEAKPGSARAYYLQAVLAARAGDFATARAVLDHVGDGLAGMPGALLLSGAIDLELGQYQQAVVTLNELFQRQPANIVARRLFAHALLRTDAAREALAVLTPAALRGDADGYTLTLVARAHERLGDRQAAAAFLDRAAQAGQGAGGAFSPDESLRVLAADAAGHPRDPAAVIPYVRALVAVGDTAGAVARATALRSANPGAPASALVLGDALAAAGRFGEAAARYREAAAARFDEPTMLRLVDAQDRAGDRAEAAKTLALFASQHPANLTARRMAAHWQLAGGATDAAVATLEELRFRVGNGDAALLAGLASAHAVAGEAERAVAYGSAAYALAPANPAVADAYGWALYRAGDLDAAAALIAKAVSIAPGHAGLRWHLAQVEADRGRRGPAIAAARAALATPGFGERPAAEALIAALG